MKKNGIASCATSWPSIALAADLPLSFAFCQCSTRTGRPNSGWSHRTTSPAAYTSSAEVRRSGPVTMPEPFSAGRDLDAGLGGQLGVRLYADADDHQVRRNHLAAGDAAPRSPCRCLRSPRPRSPNRNFDAVLPVEVGEQLPDLLPQYGGQRGRLRLDHGHLAAAFPRGRCRLEADPAGADHDHPRLGGVRVGQRL